MLLNHNQTIPCPVCKTGIPFETKLLLQGVKFTCPNPGCDAAISLADESKELVQKTVETFEAAKGRISAPPAGQST